MRLFIIMFLMTVSASVAAREFKGLLITHEKDTVSGTIITGRNRLLDEEVAVQYAIDFNGNYPKRKNISPREISGYAFITDHGDTAFYQSVIFQRKAGFTQNLSEVYVFMEVISSGSIQLYYFFDQVNPMARGASSAYCSRDKMFIKPAGSSYAVKVPIQANDEGYSEDFDYVKFMQETLGDNHPFLSTIAPGLSASALVEAIKKYNTKS